LINKYSQKFETIQILTNGLLISSSFLESISNCKNLIFQISLDGHKYPMNSLRAKNQTQHQQVLDNIDNTVRSGFDVEIYSVLHNKNTPFINDFADFLLSKYSGKVKLTIFPVRHKAAEKYGADITQLNSIDVLINEYDTFHTILPPLQYLFELKLFMSGIQSNRLRCYTPFLMMQSLDDGTVTPCPYSWYEKVGNLLTNPAELVQQFGISPSYHCRTLEWPRAFSCKSCFSDVYIYSLFFQDKIDLNELISNKIELQRPMALKHLSEFKKVFSMPSYS
jgi:MoaA/NifB/PqqE/SkfB family radical SAM enzyme